MQAGGVITTEQEYTAYLEKWLSEDVYGTPQAEKEALLLPVFSYLQQLHQQGCTEYQNIMAAKCKDSTYSLLSDLPYLAVRLFKHLELKRIDSDAVFKVLQSSGTTSQTPATIYLDKETSSRQSKTLVKILQQSIGKQRLPMLIIDSPSIVKDPKFSARAAGIQGVAFFGRDHTYVLDEQMQPNWPVIEAFAEKYAGQPVLIFGFTFMIWQYLVQVMKIQDRHFNFEKGIVIHSGGWKKLEAEKVDNSSFKQALRQTLGVTKVNNFYGMAEQVGSVFVECDKGCLHAPMMADVIIRDPYTLNTQPIGKQGLIQVLSVLPTSYPGHSLLTEDMGTLLGIDDCSCGKKGKYFSVGGRLPKTEVRGCSDTHAGGGNV